MRNLDLKGRTIKRRVPRSGINLQVGNNVTGGVLRGPLMSTTRDRKSDNKTKARAMNIEATRSGILLPDGYRPSEDEPFMNERQRAYFRRKLLTWKEEIILQTRETLQGLHEDSTQHADLADRATSETD